VNAMTCICAQAPPPNDHLKVVNPKCLAHRMDIQLVRAGWRRSGSMWWLPGSKVNPGLLSEQEAFETLTVLPASDEEEGTLP
jgi:hypothetical protein